MAERVLDALAQRFGHGLHQRMAEAALDGVAAEWERQAGLLAPPAAEVNDLVQAALGVSQLAFVNDEARVELAGDHLRDDFVERHGRGFDFRREQLQREIGRRQRAGDGDAHALDLLAIELLGRDDHWAVIFADAAAA